MRLVLFYLVILLGSFYGFGQKITPLEKALKAYQKKLIKRQDTLYFVYTKETAKKHAFLKKVFYKERFFDRQNIWVFETDIFDYFVYDRSKHHKREITKSAYLKLPILNKEISVYDAMDSEYQNYKGEKTTIFKEKILEEHKKGRIELYYMEQYYKKKKKDTSNVGMVEFVKEHSGSYHEYIDSFKVYIVEVTEDKKYILYETDWLSHYAIE